MQRLTGCLLVLVILGGALLVAPLMAAAKMRVETVVVVTSSGRHSFAAEIADTEPLRRQGLMLRTDLAQGSGMLFDNGVDREMHMWMKNTLLALDMIFITKDVNEAELSSLLNSFIGSPDRKAVLAAFEQENPLSLVAGTPIKYE